MGDEGFVITANNVKFAITDSYFDESGHRALKCKGDTAKFSEEITHDANVKLEVAGERRRNIQRNHTATHLIQHAFRKILGDHVHQAGSLVHPDYLRFDYTHFEKPDFETLNKAEMLVNQLIMENLPVSDSITTLEAAREKGAMALFGEKYSDEVRMISVGDISHELCGGTHVERSGDIGYFRITSETGVSAGVRRIEAVTGLKALHEVMNDHRTVEKFADILHSHGSDPAEKLEKLAAEKKELEKEIDKLRKSGGGLNIDKLISEAKVINGSKIIAESVETANMDAFKDLGSVIRDKMKSGICLLGADIDGKGALICVVTDDLIAKGVKAGDIVKAAAKVIGGGGGGRPHLATAGAKDASNIKDALKEGVKIAEEALK